MALPSYIIRTKMKFPVKKIKFNVLENQPAFIICLVTRISKNLKLSSLKFYFH